MSSQKGILYSLLYLGGVLFRHKDSVAAILHCKRDATVATLYLCHMTEVDDESTMALHNAGTVTKQVAHILHACAYLHALHLFILEVINADVVAFGSGINEMRRTHFK